MKILFTTPALTVGGIEVQALRLAEAFGKAGHQVILFVFHPELGDGNLEKQYDTSRFRIASLDYPPALDWISWKAHALMFRAGMTKDFRPGLVNKAFARLLRRERPDVICSLSFHQDYIACQYGRQLGIPVVLSMHGTYEYASPQWPDAARTIYERISAIIYIAEKNLSWYKAQPYFNPSMPAVKIYNGVDLETPVPATISRAALGLREEDFVFVMVARGIQEKGWLEAIEAFRTLHNHHPRTALLLIGDGAYLNELKAGLQEAGGIIFYGFHANPPELIRLADAGLLPSYFPIESLPNVILDYLRCGLPVVASDIGEIASMLTLPDGQVAGQVLPLYETGKGVSVPELAAAMEQLATDPSYYAQKAAAAAAAVRKFDLRDCVAGYEKVFKQVTAP